VFLNNNDDNRNVIMDVYETGTVTGEQDLMEVQLNLPSNIESYDGWLAELTVDSPGRIKLWATSEKGEPIPDSMTWVVGSTVIPSKVWMEGVGVGGVVMNWRLIDIRLQPQPPLMDQTRATGVRFDLDVNANGSLNDPGDLAERYLPGYVRNGDGTYSPVLTSGGWANHDSTFAPQRMKLILSGIGFLTPKVVRVAFVQEQMTAYQGYAEDRPNTPQEFQTNDYSFYRTANSENNLDESIETAGSHGTDPNAIKDMSVGTTWIDFWAKDYGGYAAIAVKVFLMQNDGKTKGFKIRTLRIPASYDQEQDYIADIWEKMQADAWESQYGTRPADPLAFFKAADDGELADSDGANADGGNDMPTMGEWRWNAAQNKFVLNAESPGDSLSVFQEYRGFVFDGGGADGDGTFTSGQGHTRLSAAYKELLVEADVMDGVAQGNVPGVERRINYDDVRTVLRKVSVGFADKWTGADIRVYWVIDQPQAPMFIAELASSAQAISWASANRNADALREFVHLMFVYSQRFLPECLGTSNRPGSYVFVEPTFQFCQRESADLIKTLAHTATHELTHLLLNMISWLPFDDGEHLRDPNENGIVNDEELGRPPGGWPDENDRRYLMYYGGARAHLAATIIFENPTRRSINLTSKESVERTI
jgi:hypothetical protein